jgi:ATP-binding cassette subfamily B protein
MVGLIAVFAEANLPLTAGLVAASTLAGLLLPVFALATGALVQAVRLGEPTLGPLALVAGLFLVLRGLAPLRREISELLWRQVDEHLARRVMAAMAAPCGLAHVEDPAILDKVAQAQGAVTGATPGQAVAHFGVVWMQRIQALLSLGLVFLYQWWAGLLLGGAYVAAFAISRWHWDQVTLVVLGRTDRLRRAYYLRTLAIGSDLAKEGRVFGLADWLVQGYRTSWLSTMLDVWQKRREGWLVVVGTALLLLAVDALVLGSVVRDAMEGAITVGMAVTVAQSILTAGMLILYLEGHWWLAEAGTAVERVEELEEAAARVGRAETLARSADGMPAHSIAFENVTFVYPGSATPVLDGLTLEIEAGRSLAIVGENGAGKTTLVKLIARLYEPTSGRITVDGVDLREISPTSWRQRISAVFQDFATFELTAHDNVAFGALRAANDSEAVSRAARDAGAAPIVERLPEGWNTTLSRQFTQGTQLSTGEWQRLALARALFGVAAGAGVLILDEPTASLDVRGEAEVYQRFLELTRGTTTLVISHRFSTVRRADRIVVLEDGRVIEDGTHEELLSLGGRYSTMYYLQASRFEPIEPPHA